MLDFKLLTCGSLKVEEFYQEEKVGGVIIYQT